MEFTKPAHRKEISKEKLQRKLLQAAKKVYHSYRYPSGSPKTILFIVGCQRSGTDLVTEILERDMKTKVYPEVSKLSSQDLPRQLRLNPLPSVKAELERERAPLVVLKPLVESQKVTELLEYFEGSRALWLFRNYRAVANSHVKKWGGGNSIRDLHAIVTRKPNNWRYENVTDELREIVLEHFSEDMPAIDAAALYWFVRNSMFFVQGLENNPRVMICKYEELVTKPVLIMQHVYQFLSFPFPGEEITSVVHTNSLEKGRDIELSPEIDQLCSRLFEQLDAVWQETSCSSHEQSRVPAWS